MTGTEVIMPTIKKFHWSTGHTYGTESNSGGERLEIVRDPEHGIRVMKPWRIPGSPDLHWIEESFTPWHAVAHIVYDLSTPLTPSSNSDEPHVSHFGISAGSVS
jgi:hypothetical protein